MMKMQMNLITSLLLGLAIARAGCSAFQQGSSGFRLRSRQQSYRRQSSLASPSTPSSLLYDRVHCNYGLSMTSDSHRQDDDATNEEQPSQSQQQQHLHQQTQNSHSILRRQATRPTIPSALISRWQSYLAKLRMSKLWTPTSALAALVVSAVVITTTLLSFPASSSAAPSAIEATSSLLSSSHRWWDSLTETGFYQAFSLVFVSEIGDKTFFIAGLLAMKTSKIISFVGSLGALAAMTLVSVIIGQIFHAVPSGIADGIPLDDIAAVLAFAFFGIKTLKEALDMEEGTSTMDEELAEATEAVEKPGLFNPTTTTSATDGSTSSSTTTTPWGQIVSIFALVFAAEFGDRSFLSTIALSAAQNPISVAGGAIAAHAAATGIAVSGGSYLAKYISERVIGLIGGTLFLVFAVTTALGIF